MCFEEGGSQSNAFFLLNCGAFNQRMITGFRKNIGAIHEIWADLLFRNLRILRLYNFFVCWSLIRNYRVSRMWWNAIKWPRHSLEWEPFSFEGGPRHWLPFHLNLAIITSSAAPPDFLHFSYLFSVFKSIATTHQEHKEICWLSSALKISKLLHLEQEQGKVLILVQTCSILLGKEEWRQG